MVRVKGRIVAIAGWREAGRRKIPLKRHNASAWRGRERSGVNLREGSGGEAGEGAYGVLEPSNDSRCALRTKFGDGRVPPETTGTDEGYKAFDAMQAHQVQTLGKPRVKPIGQRIG